MPDQTLTGKVAIVTGSNTGIGAAIAQELSSRGANVVVNYPFPDLAAEAHGIVASLPTAATCTAIEADLSTETGPQRLIDETVTQYGDTIHILVNNAGLAVNRPLARQTLDDWDLLVNLNARAVFLLVKGVLPYLPRGEKEEAQTSTTSTAATTTTTITTSGTDAHASPSSQTRTRTTTTTTVGGGRIVNIVSISARAAPPLQTIYAGTKGMVDSMTKVWAKELPPRYGCTVNAVSPGPTMTAGFAAAGEEFMRETPVIAQTPVGHRMAQPEEIAFGVAFLCEPRASWINGLHLVASGGLHIE